MSSYLDPQHRNFEMLMLRYSTPILIADCIFMYVYCVVVDIFIAVLYRLVLMSCIFYFLACQMTSSE